MPEKETLRRAAAKKRRGTAPSTQAGEFVREEMEHVKQGKHGARSSKQAIAIGLSKARRSGVDLAPPEPGKARRSTRRKAARDVERGRKTGPLAGTKATAGRRSGATAKRAPAARAKAGTRAKTAGRAATARSTTARATKSRASTAAGGRKRAASRARK